MRESITVWATSGVIALSLGLGGWSRVLSEIGPDAFAIDLRRVLQAAVIFGASGDPYELPGYLYSPFATLLAIPWTTLPEGASVGLWVAVEVVVALASTLWYVRDRAWVVQLLAVGAVMTFRPVAVDLALGNVTIIMTAAILLMCSRDRIAFGLPLGLIVAAVPKPMVLPFLVWALRYRRGSLLGVVIGVILGTTVGLALAGPEAYAAYVGALAAFDTVEFIGNEGLSFLSVPAARIVAVVVTLGFLLVLATKGPVVSLTWASVLGIFVAPYVGGYAALPFLVAVPALLPVAPIVPLLGISAFAIAGMIPVVGAGVVLALALLIRERGTAR